MASDRARNWIGAAGVIATGLLSFVLLILLASFNDQLRVPAILVGGLLVTKGLFVMSRKLVTGRWWWVAPSLANPLAILAELSAVVFILAATGVIDALL